MKRHALALCCILSACSAGPPQTREEPRPPAVEPTAEPADSKPEPLRYGDFEEKRKQLELGWTKLSKREYGYEGEIDVRVIDGVEFQRLVELRGQDPATQIFEPYLSLLGREDARFLLLDFETHPAFPEELVFAFPPTSGLDFTGHHEALQQGMLTMWGVDLPSNEHHPDLPDAPEPTEENVEVTVLGTEELRAKMDAGDDFVVFVSASGCGNVKPYRAILQTALAETEMGDQVFDFPIEGEDYDARVELAKGLLPRVAYPSLVVVKDGKPVDWQSGGGDYWMIHHAFARNGFVESRVPWVFDRTAPPEDRTRWLRGLASTRNLSASNFDDADLSGAILWFATFAGSSLRNANLEGADLKGVSFAHADLTGANLTGAKLEGVHWHRTICPDGSRSEENGGRCSIAVEK